MKNILITGTNGFIGNNLKKSLSQYNIIEINEDIFNHNAWYILLKQKLSTEKPEAVFHVGACSNTLEQDVNYMMTRNFEFTKILTDWCKENNIPLIYSSSAASYGTNDAYPSNLYGWSKYVAEQYVISNNGIALRYFNVYGPGEEHKGKMASVAYQMYLKYKKGEFIKLFPKNPLRDFIYIDDVVSANLFAWENYENLKGEKYDVGSGKAEPFEYVMEILDIPFEYYSEDMIPKGYQFYTCSDEFKWMFRWKPRFTLKQGLEKYKQYLDEET